MPVNTSFGTLNIGKDVVLDITLPDNSVLSVDITTGFTCKQNTRALDSKGLDGINRVADIPDTWSGDFMIDRASSNVDDYFAALEAGYYSGATVNAVRITQTIQEADGTVSQYRFDGVALNLNDAGNWQGDNYVKQQIAWRASKRIKVQ